MFSVLCVSYLVSLFALHFIGSFLFCLHSIALVFKQQSTENYPIQRKGSYFQGSVGNYFHLLAEILKPINLLRLQ